MRKSNEEFLREARKKNNKVDIIGLYVKQDEKILVQCKKCGTQYYALPRNILKGCGCRLCANNDNSQRLRMGKEEFCKRIQALNPNLLVIGDYVKNNVPIECKCLICGNIFYSAPSNLLGRNGRCPKCSRKALTKTQEDFVSEVKQKSPFIKIIGEYINNSERVLCECEKCGHQWSPKATLLLQGKGCPKCKYSKGERQIESFLIDNNINFIAQYTFDDCKDINRLPFDFYIPDYNMLIEYDGKQHYQEIKGWEGSNLEFTQKHDLIKTEYCCNHNIELLRIPYWDYKNIEQILTQKLINNHS